MSALNAFFDVSAVFSMAYFIVLSGVYVLFTLVAFRDLNGHMRKRIHATMDETFDSPFTPGISVVLPAYNEEAGIVESIRSLLRLRYPRFEILVVNDGSTDATIERLTEAFDLVPARRGRRSSLVTRPVRRSFVSRRFSNLWVIDKENGGKADALNVGLTAAQYPYVCAIDADAIIESDALLQVVAPILEEPDTVVATGGIVRIANGCVIDHGEVVEVRLPASRLAVLQVVEYFRGFLVGRVGWTRFNALLIISGAFGLFRRSAVEEVGGFWTDTVGEDMELVVRLHQHFRSQKAPYRITFVPDPVCWTEAPQDFRTLARQRRRWHRGLGQTLWRHRRAIFNPRFGSFGLLALPYFLVFEFLGPLVEIAGPPITIVAFLFGYLSTLFLAAFLVIAFLLGIALTIASIALEDIVFQRHRMVRDVLRMMGYAVIENVGYRQLNDLWRTMGLVDLVRRKKGWGAQRRRGIGQVVTAPVGPVGDGVRTRGPGSSGGL